LLCDGVPIDYKAREVLMALPTLGVYSFCVAMRGVIFPIGVFDY